MKGSHAPVMSASQDVAPQQVVSHLAGDGHQRNGIHIGGGESVMRLVAPGP